MPAAKTSTYTVDDAGQPEAIIITVRCRKVLIRPFDGASNYLFRAPNSNSTAVSKFNGELTIFERSSPGHGPHGYGDPGFYEVGEIIGYLETTSGTGAKTFQQEEYL